MKITISPPDARTQHLGRINLASHAAQEGREPSIFINSLKPRLAVLAASLVEYEQSVAHFTHDPLSCGTKADDQLSITISVSPANTPASQLHSSDRDREAERVAGTAWCPVWKQP